MKRVLFVNDEPNTADELSMMLQDLGYRVEQAATGAEALAKIRRDPPQVVLLDMDMPTFGSWNFLERCRRDPAGESLPIVLLASTTDAGPAAKRFRPVACVMKPVSPFSLNDALKKARSANPVQRVSAIISGIWQARRPSGIHRAAPSSERTSGRFRFRGPGSER